MTSKNSEDRITSFVANLRGESHNGLGHGVGRLARFARGGAGLARTIVGGRGSDTALSERDFRRMSELVQRLGKLKGLPMKLGQIMSYLELEMPEEARQLMSLLQTQSPATPFSEVETVLHEDLGPHADTLLEGLQREPVSIASIGQVYRGRLPNGCEVAVKVRHPSIDEAIRSDFRVAKKGGGLASLLVPGMGATVRDFMTELETRLMEECDYHLEAERQQLFGSFYAEHPVIVVPAIHTSWCGARVLTTSWETGHTFESYRRQASQAQRDQAGAALFDFYIGTLYRNGAFHADPHPGNYHFRDDGRVVVFDYGCVRMFEPDLARAFVALAQAVRSDSRERICDALEELGAEPSQNDDTYARLRGLLRSFFAPMLKSGPQRVEGRIVIQMGNVMRDKLAIARLRLPGRLVFLFRIRFGLYAVLSRLGSVCDWGAMEQRFAEGSGLRPG